MEVQASGSAEAAPPAVVPQTAEKGNKAASPPSTQKQVSSIVWEHFELAYDPRFAICQHC